MVKARTRPRVKGNRVRQVQRSADGAGTNGRIAERYHYTPYGEFIVLKGNTGSGELANVLPTSPPGNVFAHQGLPFDHDKDGYQNRWRDYSDVLHQFTSRDPDDPPSPDGLNSYEYQRGNSLLGTDHGGLKCDPPNGCTGVGPGPYNFTSCCNEHDKCYCDCDRLQSGCDNDFFDCMLALCEEKHNNAQRCIVQAQIYYGGVRNIGYDYYKAAQEAEGCCFKECD